MSNEIAQPAPQGVDALLALAVQGNLDVEKLSRLIELKNKEEDRHAMRAFSAALAAFQRECPVIPKSSKANVTGGGGFSYSYAEFDEIAKTIRPVLARHGLSFSFDTEMDGANLKAICTLRHEDGHSVRSTFVVPTATRAGMSDQQKVGAARTFANRYALLNVLGIATGEPDTDGMDPTTITSEQEAEIITLLDGTGADKQKFLDYFRVPSVNQLRAVDYDRAVAALKRKGSK